METIQATRASTSGKLQPTDTFLQASYVRWTTNQYGSDILPAGQRVYHTIPLSGQGSSGTNFDQSDLAYDAMKRQNKVVSPGGTITRIVYDVRFRTLKIYVGTNDNGATDSDPNGGGTVGNNMVLVKENQFDEGSAGGDGNLTQLTLYVNAAAKPEQPKSYRWRLTAAGTDHTQFRPTRRTECRWVNVSRGNGLGGCSRTSARHKTWLYFGR